MELDLALDAAGVDLGGDDPADLLDPTLWDSTLRTWLDHVRGDADLSCPVVVRRAEEISLGLRFTDDTVIYELNGTWRQRRKPRMCSPLQHWRTPRTGWRAARSSWATS